MDANQPKNPDTDIEPAPQARPADTQYTAIDGHAYVNSPRYAPYTGQWYFSSAFAAHSNECRCLTDPEFDC